MSIPSSARFVMDPLSASKRRSSFEVKLTGPRMKRREIPLLFNAATFQKWSTGPALLFVSGGHLLPGSKHEPPFPPELVDNGGNGGPNPVTLDPRDPDPVHFQNTVLPLLVSYCAGTECHDAITQEGDVSLYDHAHIMQQFSPGDPSNSDLRDKGTNGTCGDAMPPSF